MNTGWASESNCSVISAKLPFPILNDLAEADEQDVLLVWQGLGYYSRARRIYQSAKLLLQIVGKDINLQPSLWPIEVDKWMALPGIGRTTAGSIISSAFDLPSPILDGNVQRIICRLFALQKPPKKNQIKLWELSNLILSSQSPRNFNQAWSRSRLGLAKRGLV